MANFTLSFTLKQHTPLIHFQHDQAGATLRATEVKPKLDQFIFEKLTKKKGFAAREDFHRQLFVDKSIWKNWLVGLGNDLKASYLKQDEKNTALAHMAFDYKLQFEQTAPWFHEIEFPKVDRDTNQIKKDRKGEVERQQFPCFFGNMGEKNRRDNLKNFSFSAASIGGSIKTLNTGLKQILETNLIHFFQCQNFGTRQSKGFGSFKLCF